MAATRVIVQHRDGSPARNVRVSLGFDYGGVSSSAYTNSYGEATISHSSTGRATIFVSGSAKGSMHCPGSVAVTI